MESCYDKVVKRQPDEMTTSVEPEAAKPTVAH